MGLTKKHFIYDNAQLTEYVLACFANADPQLKSKVSGKVIGKNRNPDVVITAMNMDEKMLLLGELGIHTVIILTTAQKTDKFHVFAKESKRQLEEQKALKEEYYGKRNVFIITTDQQLKYYHLIAQYQNSRRYLFNRDFGDLIRNVKQKKRIQELENESQDIKILMRLLNAQRRSRNYAWHVLELNEAEEDILMFLAERDDKKVLYSEMERELLGNYNERALRRGTQSLMKREYIYSFEQSKAKSFILSLHGWNAVRAILEKCMIEVHK